VEGADVSEQGTPPSDDGLVVEVGNEQLEHGLVRVQVAPDGRIRVVKREQGKEQQFEGLTTSAGYQKAKLLADAWCAAFVSRKAKGVVESVTEDVLLTLASHPDPRRSLGSASNPPPAGRCA